MIKPKIMYNNDNTQRKCTTTITPKIMYNYDKTKDNVQL